MTSQARTAAGVARSALRPHLYAHRGSTVLAPENTAVAFELALGFGADVLETDVRLSRDGQVMVLHDATLERTTDGRGRVRDALARDIERLDAGNRFRHLDGGAWRGERARVDTLDTLFERFPDARINIDLKDPTAEAAERVATLIERHGRQASVTVGSFHTPVLQRFRAVAPEVATAAGKAEVAGLYFGRWIDRRATPPAPPYRYLQIPVRHLGLPLATPAFIATARRRGIECVYWTVNRERAMRALVSRGVSGIVTDRPDLLASVLAEGRGESGSG